MKNVKKQKKHSNLRNALIVFNNYDYFDAVSTV